MALNKHRPHYTTKTSDTLAGRIIISEVPTFPLITTVYPWQH